MFKVVRASRTLAKIGDLAPSVSSGQHNFTLFKIQKSNICVQNIVKFPKPCCFSSDSAAPSENGPNIFAITKGDQELEHKLKVLILEVDVMRQDGHLVPDEKFMQDNHWVELLNCPTISSRRRYLEFLFKLSKKKENRALKKELKNQEWEKIKPEKPQNETFEEFVSKYDLQHNNIFLRFYETTMNQFYNNRLIHAMQFGQKLIVDCGYDKDMIPRENKLCAKQLMMLFGENRLHDDPFDLYYCNAHPDSVLMQYLHGHIRTMYEPWFPLNICKESYLDLFPKEKLVYLSPHCREELLEYDHDSIYIIGAIVDKVNNHPLSLAKAKREGIKMAKFPLDRYLQWGSGSGKSLTLNQVASILLDVKHTGNWKHALRHVPRRKLVEYEPQKSDSNINLIGNNNNNIKRKTWSPKFNTDKINFDNTKDEVKRKNRERMLKVRSIMYD